MDSQQVITAAQRIYDLIERTFYLPNEKYSVGRGRDMEFWMKITDYNFPELREYSRRRCPYKTPHTSHAYHDSPIKVLLCRRLIHWAKEEQLLRGICPSPFGWRNSWGFIPHAIDLERQQNDRQTVGEEMHFPLLYRNSPDRSWW